MNAHPTEFRTPSDRRAQIELERLLAARRAAEAAREARFRRLPTPEQPEPANFCAVPEAEPTPLFTTAEALIFALMIGASLGVYVASVMGWLA